MWREFGRAILDASAAALSIAFGAVGGVVGLMFTGVTSSWIPLPIGLVVGIFAAGAIAYRARLRELESAHALLDRTEAAQPRIVFDRVEHSSMAIKRGQKHVLYAWQLWFKNEPRFRSGHSTAMKLSARVEWCDDSWQPVRLYVVGEWATTKWPLHRGWKAKQPKIDLDPVHEHAKLILAIKPYPALDALYAYAAENEDESPSCQHPSYKLPSSATRVRVTLVGVNVQEQQVEFRVIDPGVGQLLQIECVR